MLVVVEHVGADAGHGRRRAHLAGVEAVAADADAEAGDVDADAAGHGLGARGAAHRRVRRHGAARVVLAVAFVVALAFWFPIF